MPYCVNCGKPLKCTCDKPQQPIGQTAIDCPKLAKGRLWIHVTDDLGVNIPGVPVSGKIEQPTGGSGMAKFEDLEPGSYTAAMKPSPANLKLYDVIKGTELSKPVQVKAGVLAYVLFDLVRKAKLKVRFVVKSGTGLATESPLDAVGIPVQAVYTGDGAQPKEESRTSAGSIADFGVVSAGKYKLTPTFTGLSKDDYDHVDDPQEVELQPGDDAPVVFEVKRKAKLTVKFVLKACGPKFLDDLPFKTTAIPVKATPKDKGSTDNKTTVEDQAVLKLTPASYAVTPDYSVLGTMFEWKPEPRDVAVDGDDGDPLVFELGRKAKLKVEIVYEHDPDHHLRDTEDGIVPIKLEFLGNDFKPAATLPDGNTKEGIAEFADLSPGKYKITPDFSKLDKCKFDYTPAPCEVEVFPGVDEPVIFKVEPLYQKVHFIGHTLLAIPTQVYKPHAEDADKLTITEVPDQKRTFAYTSRPMPGLPYTAKDFADPTKVSFFGGKKLSFKKRPASEGGAPWTLADLHPDFRDTTKVEYDATWNATFKRRPETDTPYCYEELKGVWKGRYHGYRDDAEDIDHRVAFVADTLDKAFAQADKHPTVLKVFMIPECFFQGVYGAYLVDDASKLLTKLQKLVAPVKWKDWVFVFGTVNSVFAPLPPAGIGYKREIYEMRNHAPVLRGGLGKENGFGETSTRMIQKLVNSAELADELIPHPDPVRLQAINEDVQFADTENDDKVGKVLMEILNDKGESGAPARLFITDNGLPKEWWPSLTESLEGILGDWGLTRVTRAIRVACNDKINSRPLKDWVCVTIAADVNKTSEIVSKKDAMLQAVGSEWQKQYSGLERAEWRTNTAARTAVLNSVINDKTTPATEWGLILPYQKEYVQSELATLNREYDDLSGQLKVVMPALDLEAVETVAFNKIDEVHRKLCTELKEYEDKPAELVTALDGAKLKKVQAKSNPARLLACEQEIQEINDQIEELRLNPDKYKGEIEELKLKIAAAGPVELQGQALGKLIEIRALLPVKAPPTVNLSIFPIWKKLLELYDGGKSEIELKKESLHLDDYCFAGPRKAGPWFGSLSEIKGKDACKVLVFGLEICADHAANRLEAINTGADAVSIDIQLVPSAGMMPLYYAARQGGYIFNCDGWNKKPKEGGMSLEVEHDGPSPCKDSKGLDFSPTFPHTAVGKRESAGKQVGACLVPVEHDVNAGLAKVIFESGAGKLHVYPLQDLPK